MDLRSGERFSHRALFYSTWPEFIAGTVPFIREGLADGAPVLVVETHDKIRIIQMALEGAADGVEFADMSELGANPARIIPAWREFISRHGASGKVPRGIGEPIWSGRGVDELVECQRHESLLNVAFGHGEPWLLLCPYDTSTLSPEVIDEAQRSHELVVEGGSIRASPHFRGIEESGAPFGVPLPHPEILLEEIAFDGSNLAQLRVLVARHASAAGLSPERIAQLMVAVNEVATNSVRHGGGNGILGMWHDTNKVICEVRNQGTFHNPLVDRERPGPDHSAPRGLWLANQVCDLVQIRTFGNETVVRLHMVVKPEMKVRVMPGLDPGPAAKN
jgi:anti-sigma regulatory factor (Ser/Thr protein kinase)